MAAYILESPTGKYAKQIGFFYELLTGIDLPMDGLVGNYIPALDPTDYVTAEPVKNPRWRVENNLLGTPRFSPIVRLTAEVKAGLSRDWKGQIEGILADTPPALLHRALSYLYAKETRSSYLIEREEPGRAREERFIAALRNAGKVPIEQALSLERLVALQNTIVDPRYAEKNYRDLQNYVGETLPGMREQIHYITVPPQLLPSLMEGLAQAGVRMESVPALVQAAVLGFQFVFIHPFEDGNGRLHRFLFQDVLARRGVTASGAALPISAAILDNLHAYDDALEDFSLQSMKRSIYTFDDSKKVTLTNPEHVEPLWRFPDLTRQVEYLIAVMARAVEVLPKELGYLRHYDRARAEIRGIVDLPDQRLNSLMKWLDAGQGKLSNNKRKQFAELTDEEIRQIEEAYEDGFAED
ncbi:Fic family protein [Oleiharenicola lentus]|uniref:Fic family protein n=1 Tax=Oleiharenicola lentus TaxID=2508720 RepID=UPI003F67651B